MKISVFCVLLLFGNSGFAKNWDKAPDDQLRTRIGIIIPSYSFKVQSSENELGKKLTYSPNASSLSVVGLDYRNISLGVGSANATEAKDDLNKGTSKSFDVQLRFFGKKTFEVLYQSYTGFYIEESELISSSYQNTSLRYKLPDLKTQSLVFNWSYNFDYDDFDLAVGLNQSGRQLESGWARFLIASLNSSQISNSSSILPTAIRNNYGDFYNIREFRNTSANIGLGVGGTAVATSYFASAYFALGVGLQSIKTKSETEETTAKILTGTYTSFRFSTGYNGIKHQLTVGLIADDFGTTVLKSQVNTTSIEGSIRYAYKWDGVDLPLANKISAWFD